MDALLVTIINIVAFFGVGLLTASFLERRKFIGRHFMVITAYGVSCLIGYLLFYIYALSPMAGAIGSILFYCVGLAAAVYLAYVLGSSAALRRTFRVAVWPLMIIIISISLVYSAITYSCTYRKVEPGTPWVFYEACVLYNATGDNVLAQHFSWRILANNENQLDGDWHLADRPPLQIGNVISALDLTSVGSAQSASYAYLSMILQLSWAAGLWALLSTMRVRRKSRYLVLFVSAITGFYYYNTIYAWPKFMAASFGLSALAILIYKSGRNKKLRTEDWLVATVFAVLSLLAHGSAVFLLIPLAIYLLATRRLPGVKQLLLCLLAAFVFYAPWAAYQHITAPNQRLIKWQLAGVISAEDKRSASQTIVDSYHSLTFGEWLRDKADNIGELFVTNFPNGPVHVAKDPTEQSVLDHIRKQEFFALLPALGILNLGWLVLIRRRIQHRKLAFDIGPLAKITGLGFMLWILLMFIPESTVNHQNSYALIISVFTILILALASLPSRLLAAVIGLQALSFYLIWVYGMYILNHQRRILALVSLAILGFGLLALRTYRQVEE